MLGFRQKNSNVARIFWLRILAISSLFVIFLLIRGAWDVYQKERQTSVKRKAAEAELTDLNKRHRDLKEEVARLKSARGVEEELRKQFDVAREGEGVIVIVDRPIEEPELPKQEKSWWSNLWPF